MPERRRGNGALKQKVPQNGYNYMEKEELKRQMMALWKEIFHDTDSYISLVFDNYFNEDYIEYEEENGRVIASLIAIPYSFGNNNYTINSVYLCGLSTSLKHRKRGIMTGLLTRIEHKMHIKGIAFMFLIPADVGLRRYYSDRGYINGFYKIPHHFTSVHDFNRDHNASLINVERALAEVKRQYYSNLEVTLYDNLRSISSEDSFDEVCNYILESESQQKGLCIFQSKEQIKVVIRESEISGGKIAICRNSDKEIAGIGFYSFLKNEIFEKGRYVNNYASICKIREKILSTEPNRNMTVYQYGYESNVDKSIWSPLFNTNLPDAGQVGAVGTIERSYNPNQHSEVYGMVRILSVYEILKFQSKWRKDLKYSILTRQENDGKIVEYSASNGHVKSRELKIEDRSIDHQEGENKNKKIMYMRNEQGESRLVLSERDLGDILFRRPGVDRMVEEAFGLPAMNGRISLLLD